MAYWFSVVIKQISSINLQSVVVKWMNVNAACHTQPAFKQGGTIAEHPVHRPRMPLPCADRTRRCLFFPPLHHHHHPSLFLRRWCSAQAHLLFTSRLRLKCHSSRFPPTFAAVFRQSCLNQRSTASNRSCLYRRLILLFIFLFLLPALGEGCRGWKPALVASSWTRSWRLFWFALYLRGADWKNMPLKWKSGSPVSWKFPVPVLKTSRSSPLSPAYM